MKAAGLVVKESVYYRDPMLSSDITVGTQDSHSRVQGHRYPIYLAETTLKPTLGSACPLNMIRADTLSQSMPTLSKETPKRCMSCSGANRRSSSLSQKCMEYGKTGRYRLFIRQNRRIRTPVGQAFRVGASK